MIETLVDVVGTIRRMRLVELRDMRKTLAALDVPNHPEHFRYDPHLLCYWLQPYNIEYHYLDERGRPKGSEFWYTDPNMRPKDRENPCPDFKNFPVHAVTDVDDDGNETVMTDAYGRTVYAWGHFPPPVSYFEWFVGQFRSPIVRIPVLFFVLVIGPAIGLLIRFLSPQPMIHEPIGKRRHMQAMYGKEFSDTLHRYRVKSAPKRMQPSGGLDVCFVVTLMLVVVSGPFAFTVPTAAFLLGVYFVLEGRAPPGTLVLPAGVRPDSGLRPAEPWRIRGVSWRSLFAEPADRLSDVTKELVRWFRDFECDAGFRREPADMRAVANYHASSLAPGVYLRGLEVHFRLIAHFGVTLLCPTLHLLTLFPLVCGLWTRMRVAFCHAAVVEPELELPLRSLIQQYRSMLSVGKRFLLSGFRVTLTVGLAYFVMQPLLSWLLPGPVEPGEWSEVTETREAVLQTMYWVSTLLGTIGLCAAEVAGTGLVGVLYGYAKLQAIDSVLEAADDADMEELLLRTAREVGLVH